jgi:hypothetical protein
MLQKLSQIATLLFVLGLMLGALLIYRKQYETDRKVERLEDEKRALTAVVSHLTTERRVAELIVTSKRPGSDGIPITNLLLVEIARNGSELPPRAFTVRGQFVHIDAMLIKFDREDVKAADPLRGCSIALFTRIYGDQEAPASAAPIDPPGTVPEIYRDADPTLATFELNLWKDFWRLASDRAYAASRHVRIANGQGVWGMFEPDQLYTLTIESDGGLNLSTQPLAKIYQALQHP